jgi:hypothetical protein
MKKKLTKEKKKQVDDLMQELMLRQAQIILASTVDEIEKIPANVLHKRKTSAEFRFLMWRSLPRKWRTPRSQAELARLLGVESHVLTTWAVKSRNAVAIEQAQRLIRQFTQGEIIQDWPELTNAVKKHILKTGDVNAWKYMREEGFGVPAAPAAQISTVVELTIAQLAASDSEGAIAPSWLHNTPHTLTEGCANCTKRLCDHGRCTRCDGCDDCDAAEFLKLPGAGDDEQVQRG